MWTPLHYFSIILIGEVSFGSGYAAHQDGDVMSHIEISRMEVCPNCSDQCDKNYKAEFKLHSQWKRDRYVQYFSGKLYVEETFKMKRKVLFKSNEVVYKCENSRQSTDECERFGGFYIDSKTICALLMLKNQWWTPVLDAIHPRNWTKTCPIFNEGIVHLNNATVDADLFVNIYPHLVNYVWKFHTFIENAYNKKLLCTQIVTNVKKYTYRRRKNGK